MRDEVLKEHPELKAVLQKLDGILSDNVMAKINYEVETKEKEPKEAAMDFLKSKGLME